MADYLVTLVWDTAPDGAESGLAALDDVWVSASNGRLVTSVLASAERLLDAYDWGFIRVAPYVPGVYPIGFAIEPPSDAPHFRVVKDDA
jgi:hypothetical protein